MPCTALNFLCEPVPTAAGSFGGNTTTSGRVSSISLRPEADPTTQARRSLARRRRCQPSCPSTSDHCPLCLAIMRLTQRRTVGQRLFWNTLSRQHRSHGLIEKHTLKQGELGAELLTWTSGLTGRMHCNTIRETLAKVSGQSAPLSQLSCSSYRTYALRYLGETLGESTPPAPSLCKIGNKSIALVAKYGTLRTNVGDAYAESCKEPASHWPWPNTINAKPHIRKLRGTCP